MMFRLVKKKSTRSLYWSIILLFLICLITAFIYYFVLIDELELKPKNIVNNENIEKQINYRLAGLELGLKQNRDILKNIRFKLDRVIKEFNGNVIKSSDQMNSYIQTDKSLCLNSKSLNGI